VQVRIGKSFFLFSSQFCVLRSPSRRPSHTSLPSPTQAFPEAESSAPSQGLNEHRGCDTDVLAPVRSSRRRHYPEQTGSHIMPTSTRTSDLTLTGTSRIRFPDNSTLAPSLPRFDAVHQFRMLIPPATNLMRILSSSSHVPDAQPQRQPTHALFYFTFVFC